MRLAHGSLFSGIGGFDLGFERAGIETIWQVEIDDYCRRVLARHFPYAQRYDDVRTAGKHNLAPVDIISGGFPCQDISNAGKRAGIDGERSGLWSEYARIIGELRPRFVVVENVAALLGRGMGRVLGDLAALGYDAEWESISAADFGAPHLRERIWIMAYPVSLRHDGATTTTGTAPHKERNDSAYREEWRAVNGEAESGRQDVAHSERSRIAQQKGCKQNFGGWLINCSEKICNATEQRFSNGTAITLGESRAHAQPERSDWWATEPDVGRVAHGVPNRVDRLRGLGNAIVPQIAEWIGRQIVGRGL